jgi:signal transduction histidine kinase
LEILADGKETGPAELKLLRADGSSVQVEAISRQIDFQGARAVLTVVRDITKRKKLERELLDVSAREQRRIGHDLHDILGQNLAGAAFLGKALDQKIVGLVSNAVAQARALSRALAAEGATEDLATALRELAANSRALFGIACAPEIHGEPECDEATAGHLYHIALEAVNNAAKHGGATRIGIKFVKNGDRQTLSITDNGKGFAPEASGDHQGMGLRIMRYRATVIGAVLEIESRPGSGVTVSCALTPA